MPDPVIQVIDAGSNITIMAKDGSRSVGVANADLDPREEGWWWLARLKVEERSQGVGLGSLLLYHLLKTLSEKETFGLIVAPGGYGSSIRRLEKFYRANGFKREKGEEIFRWRKSTGGPALPVLTRTDSKTSGSGVATAGA